MKQNYSHITLVLDRSGSMESVKADTIGGFNSFLKNQQEFPGEATFSLVQFDTEYEHLMSFTPIKEAKYLTNATFVPRGGTALYDAVGRTIIDTGDKLAKMNENDRPDKILFVILTDGFENSSVEFRSEKIKEMIKHQNEKYNWQFVFLGANQDAILTARQQFGIKERSSMTYTATGKGMQTAYASLNNSTLRYRGCNDNTKGFSFTDEEKEENNPDNQQAI